MARITVEDCLTKETNRFALVQLASKRTKQLLGGASLLIDDSRDNKSVVSALREIAAGKVRFKTEKDFRKEREIALREREAELQKAAEEEKLRAIAEASADEESTGTIAESDSSSEEGNKESSAEEVKEENPATEGKEGNSAVEGEEDSSTENLEKNSTVDESSGIA